MYTSSGMLDHVVLSREFTPPLRTCRPAWRGWKIAKASSPISRPNGQQARSTTFSEFDEHWMVAIWKVFIVNGPRRAQQTGASG